MNVKYIVSEDITPNFKFLDFEPAGENLPEKHFYKITKPFSKQNRSEIQTPKAKNQKSLSISTERRQKWKRNKLTLETEIWLILQKSLPPWPQKSDAAKT